MRIAQIILLAILVVLLPYGAFAQAADTAFKAGAAKIDITPTQLPKNSEGILDHIYARAIVIDNGATRAALVSVDVGMLGEQVWRTVSQRIEKELGIPAQNLIMNPTHTHSASGGTAEQLFNVVKAAGERLRPARIGYGTGVSYINVNRNIIDRKTNKWWEGPNYDGPSDKTVAVIGFETTDGEPIAVYYNYACHAVITGNTDMLSGDFPGATSRYIEDSFDDKIVALFSTGAQGDQNPIYFQQTFDLRDIRVKDYAKRGQDISNAMPPGGQGLNKQDPTVKKLLDQQKQMILSMGQMLGEEVKRVMREMVTARMTAGGRIFAAQKMVRFPGRNRIGQGRAGVEAAYTDGPDVQLRLSLLMIDDIAIGGCDAEVFNMIAQRFKKESPVGRSIFVSMANGIANSGYIPNDAAFGYQTFEVLSSRCKPGYAESAIVNGILDLMAEAKRTQ
ncbi:MAG: neutral/alkaline non-lysosomal ceramidase N-terminal domain-containing protein [Acidobacteria bacterium]|nr:neutral/alkaline non-lysosomal ceramidase N-terminal domain-containing protein [Acidobacteriota bacterium]